MTASVFDAPLWELSQPLSVAEAGVLESLLEETGWSCWSLRREAATGQNTLSGYFSNEAEALLGWRTLREMTAGLPDFPAHSKALPACDWRDSYKAHFQPWSCGRLHWIPLWLRASHALPRGAAAVYLDPGMAFGTGAHPTTRLCARRLMEAAILWKKNLDKKMVVDAGCGSGILALSAAALGGGPTRGFDNDPEAVRVARDNARLNGLGGRVRFRTAALPNGLKPGADLLLANIQADILVRHADALLAAVRPGGRLILSGILAGEWAAVRAVYRRQAAKIGRLASWKSRQEEEWADLCVDFRD